MLYKKETDYTESSTQNDHVETGWISLISLFDVRSSVQKSVSPP